MEIGFGLVIDGRTIEPVPSDPDTLEILRNAMANNACPGGEYDGSGISFFTPEEAHAALGGLKDYLAGDPGF